MLIGIEIEIVYNRYDTAKGKHSFTPQSRTLQHITEQQGNPYMLLNTKAGRTLGTMSLYLWEW